MKKTNWWVIHKNYFRYLGIYTILINEIIMEENSISIINRTNGQLTGEKAQALPVKFVANFSWVKIFLLGFVAAIILFVLFIAYVKQQVTVIEVTGKAPNYQEYQIN